jgi:DNA polymerase-1
MKSPVPATKEALQLLMEGAVASSKMSANGIRIDVPYLDQKIKEVRQTIETLESELRQAPEYKCWQKMFGLKMKLQAPYQLGQVIFRGMGHKRNPFLQDSNEEVAFEHLKLPFLKLHFQRLKLKKALTTNLYGIKRETVSGFCHPSFLLDTTVSNRLSCRNPNFQNVPGRNKVISEIVRSCVIPREGHEILNGDYSVQEVRVAYCYCKDQRLLHDILHGDMHKDRALELFLLTPEEMGNPKQGMGKKIRQEAKNKFTFAQFYGDYYGHCAPLLWDAITMEELTTAAGVPLHEHLKSKGIGTLGLCDPEQEPKKGTFEYHVQKVERKMWDEVYVEYTQWKKDWYNLYLAHGAISTLTGFRHEGVFSRNQILNFPVQGSAAHCLLWSHIQIQKEMTQRRMKSKIIFTIHDSLGVDAHKKEIDDVCEMMYRWSVVEIQKHWPWIIVPLSLEFGICPVNWYQEIPLEVKL